jgi:hypothetical protein
MSLEIKKKMPYFKFVWHNIYTIMTEVFYNPKAALILST